MRNLLSCLQSVAFRPTSVAVVAQRHGSYTLGLLSLYMSWKRLISNLHVVFQGAKKAVKAKKKTLRNTGKLQDAQGASSYSSQRLITQ